MTPAPSTASAATTISACCQPSEAAITANSAGSNTLPTSPVKL